MKTVICKQSAIFFAAILVSLFSASCSTTTSNVYVPSKLGRVIKEDINPKAELEIYPDQNRFEQGDPIEFTITLKNTSTTAYWVPKKLSPTFIWYFGGGRRDGQLPQSNAPRNFTPKQAVLLEPGEELSTTKTLKTNYFRREGLVEFQAILRIPANTNDDLQPFLSSSIRSNGYGIILSDDEEWRGDLDPSRIDTSF